MREVVLHNSSLRAIIDDEDYELVSQHKWYALKGHNTMYAEASHPNSGGKVLMHRLILKPGELHVDHIDNNGLNNQRSNLRFATTSQNQMNARKQLDTTSKYKGVHYCKREKRWQARIAINGLPRRSLGYFSTEVEAAQAYNLAASKLFGEYAKLNKTQLTVRSYTDGT